jgi:tape measure domain-containing protein
MADTKLEATITLKDDLSPQLSNVTRGVDKANTAFSGLTGSVFKANVATLAVSKGLSLIGDVISGVVNGVKRMGNATKDFMTDSLDMAGALEQVRISLDLMTGSAAISRNLLLDLSKFAQRTPFNLTDLQQYAKQFIALNYSVDEVIPLLTKLGNVAAGVGMDKLPQIAYAMTQVKTNTKLMSQELNQFLNASVPMIEYLARVMGINQTEVRKYVELGKVGYKEVEDAMALMTAEGERFHDTLCLQSASFVGLKSNFEDFVDTLKRRIGGIDEAGDIIKGGLLDKAREGFQLLNEKLGENSGIVDKVTEKISKLGGGLIDLVLKGGEAILKSEAVRAKFTEVKDSVVNLMKAIMGEDGVSKAFETLTGTTEETSEKVAEGVLNTFKNLIDKLTELVNWVKDNKQEIKDFLKDVKDVVKAISDMIGKLNELNNWSKKNKNLFDTLFNMQFLGIPSALGITKKATGTSYAQGGMTLVGERGAELVNLPRGSKVTPNEALGGQGGTMNINIDVSGAMITNQDEFIQKLTNEISRTISNQSRLNMYGIQ